MLVAALRVKNEAWVIKYTLSALSEFVDKIVVVDDGSRDDTVAICQSFAKVVAIHENGIRPENKVNEAADWNKLTELARAQGAAWILYTDADEMLEPEIKNFVLDLPNLDNINMVRFRKISPWRGITHYRTDKKRFDNVAKNTLNPVIVNAQCPIKWDDGRGGFLKKAAKFAIRGERILPSLGRGFPKGVGDKVKNVDDILSVHFNSLSMDRLIRKQVFYALVEKRMRPLRTRDDLVEWVSIGWSEEGMTLEPVQEQWLWQDYVDLIERDDVASL